VHELFRVEEKEEVIPHQLLALLQLGLSLIEVELIKQK